MLHFETYIAQPTVDFCVPDLDGIASMDRAEDTIRAIVQMNALVLGVYTHFPEGLAQFRKLSEADETTLEGDMLAIGAGVKASINKNTYTGYNLTNICTQLTDVVFFLYSRDEHYYYLRLNYFHRIEQLQKLTEELKNELEDTQVELNQARESSNGKDLLQADQESRWQVQINRLEDEQEECNSKM